ncbi:hypothetical protein GCM10027053_22380 [Intrasporangium mesophilum]
MSASTRLLTGALAVVGLATTVALAPVAHSAEPDPLMASVVLPESPSLDMTLGVLVTPSDGAPTGVRYATTWSANGVQVATTTGLALGVRYFGSSVTATVTATAPDGRTQSLTTAPTEPLTRFGADTVLRSTNTAVSIESGWSGRAGTYTALAGQVTITQSWLSDGTTLAAGEGAAPRTHEFSDADRGHRLTHRFEAVQPATGLTYRRDTGPTPVVGSISGSVALHAVPQVLVGARLDWMVGPLSYYPPRTDYSYPDMTASWTRDGRVVPWPSNYGKAITSNEAGSVVGVRVTVTRPGYTGTFDAQLPRVPGTPYTDTQSGYGLRELYRRLANGQLEELRWNQSATGKYLSGSIVGSGWGGMTALATGGDLTNDGQMDILARDSTGTLWTYSRGWMTERPRVKLGVGWNSMNLFVLGGDYDGDRFGDLLARRSSDGALLLYRGTGAGTVRSGTLVTTGLKDAKALVSVGDANGDGRSDLHATFANGDLYFYAGRGDGTFKPGVRVGTSWQGMRRILSGGDWNGDGREDLFALDGSNRLWVYRGLGNGAFGSRTEISYHTPFGPSIF